MDFGDTNTVSPTGTSNSGFLYAYPATVVSPGNASALAIYIPGSANSGRLSIGLYSNNAGAPQSLLASGSVSAASSSWNRVPGSGTGNFNHPVDTAVDPSSGDVFVSDSGNNRIVKLQGQ